MKRISTTLFSLFLCVLVNAQSASLTLAGQLQFTSPQRASGIWHYVDSIGNEYAIVGVENGICIVDVTNPATPQLLFQLEGNSSLWHEVKVSGHYAYAVSEGTDTSAGTPKNGVQIINLEYLPDSVPNKFWKGNGAIQDSIRKAHSITADNNYIYVNGHNINSLGRGVLICDISDPWNPNYVGAITTRYCHDSYVRGDTIYTSDIYDGKFTVYDIADRTNPVMLAEQTTPNIFNHNSWLNDAGNVLFTTDEHNNSPLAAYDISNLSNITLLDLYNTTNTPDKEVHNVRVLNDFAINPSYGSQLTIADVSHPDNIIEVANYPTGSFLCWDADPYLPSGNLIATDVNNGLFVFTPVYERACWLEGTITDSITGANINNGYVNIQLANVSDSSNAFGIYKTGYAAGGLYDVTFNATGYHTKTYTGIQLTNGMTTILDAQLVLTQTAVNDIELNSVIDIYPVPASDQIRFHADFILPEVSLKIEDMLGRTIFSNNNFNMDDAVDITAFVAGKYLVSFVTKDTVYKGSFVKQ